MKQSKGAIVKYRKSRLIRCSPNGSCPLEELCEYWSERAKCEWPDKQEDGDGLGLRARSGK